MAALGPWAYQEPAVVDAPAATSSTIPAPSQEPESPETVHVLPASLWSETNLAKLYEVLDQDMPEASQAIRDYANNVTTDKLFVELSKLLVLMSDGRILSHQQYRSEFHSEPVSIVPDTAVARPAWEGMARQVQTQSELQSKLQSELDNLGFLPRMAGDLHATGVDFSESEQLGEKLVVGNPVVTLKDATDTDFQSLVSNLGFKEKPSLPAILKRFNVIIFEAAAQNVTEFFGTVAKAIGILPEDGLNAYQVKPGTFALLWLKNDQRKVSFPDSLTFKTRFTLEVRNTQAFWKAVSGVVERLGSCITSSVCMLRQSELCTNTKDLVLAAKSLTCEELLHQRLAASMTSPKERTPFQHALMNGWATLTELCKDPDEMDLEDVLFTAGSPLKDVPRLSSYSGWTDDKYGCFDILWDYWDPVSGSNKPTTLQEIIENAASPAHFTQRSIVLMGKTRDGKTYFGRALCRVLAMVCQMNGNSSKFLEISNHEQMKIPAIKEQMQPGVPLLLDDISPGKTMHPDAVPQDFLKAFFGPHQGKMLHCRNHNAKLAVGPCVWTTNDLTLDGFLQLKSSTGALDRSHIDAVKARIVRGYVRCRMYSDAQAEEVGNDRAEDFADQLKCLNALMAAGEL